ncbi:1-aminocyclopropane-1-carboxylate deaminase/D-cysteine desulfhydrase [Marinobacterium aestuariivivens]|uniref:1-aminocyclopropane-1-carboxylate deaminase/D-cysteine desulfhydrase n=1 Tax=Marinobacterium aestuariivivens TaxID=1698799 RepID=A0ABW1ZTL6_9GAMM
MDIVLASPKIRTRIDAGSSATPSIAQEYRIGAVPGGDPNLDRHWAGLLVAYAAMSSVVSDQTVSLSPPLLQKLQLELYRRSRVEVWLLRLDTLHPQVSGNKGFKLKYALEEAQACGAARILSFGGAFSNHIHALAFAGFARGIDTIGVIRGESDYAGNPTLSDAASWGMRLHFVDRATYRRKAQQAFLSHLEGLFGPCYLIAEGGCGPLATRGCREILGQVPAEQLARFDLIAVAVGTGGTLSGLIASRPAHCRLLGFPVLKGAEFLFRDIRSQLADAGIADPGGWHLQLDAHGGGYGCVTTQLAAFLAAFERETGILLDPVYTGKMLLRFNQQVADGDVPAGSRVLLIHTGGLQGLRGMAKTLYDRRLAFQGALPL